MMGHEDGSRAAHRGHAHALLQPVPLGPITRSKFQLSSATQWGACFEHLLRDHGRVRDGGRRVWGSRCPRSWRRVWGSRCPSPGVAFGGQGVQGPGLASRPPRPARPRPRRRSGAPPPARCRARGATSAVIASVTPALQPPTLIRCLSASIGSVHQAGYYIGIARGQCCPLMSRLPRCTVTIGSYS